MTLPPVMSHSRCSELLGPFVRGDLTLAEGAAVQSHLSDCADCTRELVAVTSLLEAPGAAMDDLERARLHAGIAGGLRQSSVEGNRLSRGGAATRAERSAPRKRLVGPGAWLGAAAATLILFVGGAVYLGSGGFVAGGSDQGGATSQGEGGESAGGKATAPRPDVTEDGSNPSGRALGPLVARGRTGLNERSLATLGRTAPSFRAFAGAYGPEDVSRLQRRFWDALATGLGDALVGPCLAQARRMLPGTLPAYGATGMLDGRRVLVLGFFIPGTGAGDGRFAVKWWDAGSLKPGTTCPHPLGSARGAI